MATNLNDDNLLEAVSEGAWERAYRRALEETRLRAAKLPAKQRQRIPVISTGGKP